MKNINLTIWCSHSTKHKLARCIVVSTKFTTSTNNTWKQCTTSGWNSGHRKSPAWNLGDFDPGRNGLNFWTMLKHQNYGSKIGSGMRFPCFTKLRLIDSELRMIFLNYSPSSSIVYGFRPLSENMLRLEPLATIDQWVNIQPQTEVATSMDVSYLVPKLNLQ